MKRFYDKAAITAADAGFAIALDGRPVNTPVRAPLRVPSEVLALAIAAEWNAQGDKVDPRSMPLTGLANAAIDRIGPERDRFIEALTVFGETDLLCYRAEGPDSLVDRQEVTWDPLLAWARARYDVDFMVVNGVMHRHQPEATVERLRAAIEARDDFALAGLSPLVTIAGSLVIALALAEGAVDVDQAWAAATVDDRWQIEQWGEDAEAMRRLAARGEEFAAAHAFLTLLHG